MRIVWFKTLALTAAIAASSSVFAVTLEGGAVAAPNQYGADVAAQILKKGGNAVDAATLFGLYLTSTLYHSVRGPAKDVLRRMDHCAIYLLIAGSYTPFTLVSLRGPWGWWLFGVVWSLAVIGIVQEIWYAKGARVLSLVIYVLMGWVGVAGASPLIDALGWDGFLWLAAGGVVYTVGIGFFVTDHKWRYGHGVWHLFVLGGSACHFGAVLWYVA